jgi:membrane-associated phospholipid phosphatase
VLASPPPPMRRLTPIRPGLVLAGLAAVYVAAMAVLAAYDSYFFVRKAAIVPLFCLAALASNRLTAFVRDWSVFLALTFVFDAARGALYACIAYFELPVYMGYAIAAERALLGGAVMPVLLQQHLFDGTPGLFERLLVIVHASHFVFFLAIGFAIWLLRREAFQRYCAVMVIVMYAGLLFYALVPTVPPWMAAAEYEVIAPVERIPGLIYTRSVPRMYAALATNPVAAMPSLHAAFPAAAALVALQVLGPRAWWTILYTAVSALSVVYLGEHYLVDVLAGWLLGVAAWFVIFRVRGPRVATVPERSDGPGDVRRAAVMAAGIAAVLFASAEGIAALKSRLQTVYVPSGAFIERELVGKSPKASHYSHLRAVRDSVDAAR